MAIPVLKLNLAPPPSLWRRQHTLLSWSVLGLGAITLTLVAGLTWRAYRQANEMGRGAFLLSRQTQESLARQGNILAQLRAIDVKKELPRWKLSERILAERSSPWSRLTAELERSLVQDVRIKSIQRTRSTDQQVAVKLKGEARTRAAEANFVESIQQNAFFSQVILEREAERPGGGVDFEYTLPVTATPAPYVALPEFGPSRTPPAAKVNQALPAKRVEPKKPTPKAVPVVATKPIPTAKPQPPAVVQLPPIRTIAPSAATDASGEPPQRKSPRMLRPQPLENQSEPRRSGENNRPNREVR